MNGEDGGSRNNIWTPNFPGGPVVETSPSNEGGARLIPGWGTKTLQHKTGNIVTNSKKSTKKLKTIFNHVTGYRNEGCDI